LTYKVSAENVQPPIQPMNDLYKKASIRWQDSAPPISGYWPNTEPNAG